MAEYYVVRDKNTGLYFRGKGVNRWGKYYNQASIYRIRANAENTIKEVSWRGEQAEVVPIQIVEKTADVVEVKHGEWKHCESPMGYQEVDVAVCSICGEEWVLEDWDIEEFAHWNKYCSMCGAKMDGTPKERGGEK